MSEQPAAATRRSAVETGVKLRGAEKLARIPVKVIPAEEVLRKPDWIRSGVTGSGKHQADLAQAQAAQCV